MTTGKYRLPCPTTLCLTSPERSGARAFDPVRSATAWYAIAPMAGAAIEARGHHGRQSGHEVALRAHSGCQGRPRWAIRGKGGIDPSFQRLASAYDRATEEIVPTLLSEYADRIVGCSHPRARRMWRTTSPIVPTEA